MLKYLARRIVGTIPVIILISLLVFTLIHAAPGDPADLLLPEDASDQDVALARERWGLDQPIWVQYWKFLSPRCKAISAPRSASPIRWSA